MSKTPPQRRLTNPDQAEELFRLAIDRHFLGVATALVVCCDREARPVAHVHLVECDPAATPSDLSEVLHAVLDRAEGAGTPEIGGVALGLTRPGGEQVQPYDQAWFRAFYRVCHVRCLVAHGVFLVTRVGARAIHIDDAA